MNSFNKSENTKPVSLSLQFGSIQFRVRKGLLNEQINLKEQSSLFGFIYEGYVETKSADHQSRLGKGMYFSCNSSWNVQVAGQAILIECEGYQALNQSGGPYEKSGRLRYIDTCTDSLIIPPVKKGDPCLNVLYFPKNIIQTAHTHPSFRIGIVLEGEGVCVAEGKETPLKPLDFFYIPENVRHSFNSHTEKGLIVLAFHPDSDFGPTDEVHPMINRTIL